MRKIISLNQLFDKFRSKGFNTLMDKFTFFHIFLIWTLIIIVFGLMYYLLTSSYSFLFYNPVNSPVGGVLDSIYFSFVTATSTGYGDILPFGLFKVMAIVEVVFGLMLLAFVTSKLISIKQDVILSEIYEISFNEKINRLRSSLLVFRQNLNRIINKIEEGSVRKRELNDVYTYFSSFEDILNEVESLMGTSSGNYFKKVLDPLSTELLFNSILSSFEKMNELIAILNQAKSEWRRDITLDLINRCISINDALFSKLNSSKNVSEKTITDLNSQKSKVVEMIRGGLSPVSPVTV